jgi:hypothetical protein
VPSIRFLCTFITPADVEPIVNVPVNPVVIKSLQLLPLAPVVHWNGANDDKASNIASVAKVGTPVLPEPSITQLDAVFQSVLVVPLQIGIS